MRTIPRLLLLFLWIVCVKQATAEDTTNNWPKGLVDIHGQALPELKGPLRVYCVLGVECPVSRFYAPRMQQLADQFASAGVQFVGVFSNLQDSREEIERYSQEFKLTFPLLHDVDQALARRLGATRVPEVFVMDSGRLTHYQGRVDDQYSPGIKRAAADHDHLRSAIERLLKGESPLTARTEPVGCRITYAQATDPSSTVTYCKTIAPLFNAHCVECHRRGEIGPFDITDYAEVRGWAEMILEVVEQQRMPPWHASPEYGSFKNARHLPEDAVDLLRQWVRAGAPYGSASDLPEQPKFIEGWRLPRTPEQIVAMRNKPYHIPASGTVDYQYFVVDPEIKEDRWVSAAQIIPGNPAVVHHAIVFVRPPDGVEFNGIGWLTAYVPGQRATTFPEGYARKIPAGSKFVFQMHYTPNGQAQEDLTRVGLNFMSADQVTHQVFTLVGIDQEFEIPPGQSDHTVSGVVNGLPGGGQLLAVIPHMHLRGKAFELGYVPETESSESLKDKAAAHTLLSVPRYDFNWQHTYELTEPFGLDAVRSLEFKVTFDNSRENPFNPNPDEYVVWGDQTWEEMAVAFLEVARPRASEKKELDAAPSGESRSVTVGRRRRVSATANSADPKPVVDPTPAELEFTSKFMAKFDGNRDGQVQREEANRIVRDLSFNIIDDDRDGRITKEELLRAVRANRAR